MPNLSEFEYKQALDAVLEWFKKNVHIGEYNYEIYNQEDSHICIVDVIPQKPINYRFRVILEIGYNILLDEKKKMQRTINDIKVFQKFGSFPNITYQKCMIVVKYPKSYDISHAYLMTLADLSEQQYRISELREE